MLRSQLVGQDHDLVHNTRTIRVRTHAGACLIVNKSGALHKAADRDRCMQYILAVTILKGEAPVDADYRDDSTWATDPRISSLRAKSRDCGGKEASAVTAELNDGTETEEVLVEYACTEDAVRAKTERNLGLIYNAEEVRDMFRNLPIQQLVDLFWKGRD